MSENNAGNSVETKTPEELKAALAKAEAKIVDLKKNASEKETSSNENDNNENDEKKEESQETF
jgi:hypothetical protein